MKMLPSVILTGIMFINVYAMKSSHILRANWQANVDLTKTILNLVNVYAMKSSHIPRANWQACDYVPHYNVDLTKTILNLIKDDIKDGRFVWHYGCRVGKITEELKKFVNPAYEILATDISSSLIEQAKFYNFDNRIKYDVIQDDKITTLLPWADMVFSLQYMHWIKDKAIPLKNIFEQLAPGGLAVIVMNWIDEPENSLERWKQSIPEIFDYVPLRVKRTNDLIGMYSLTSDEAQKLFEAIGFTNIEILKVEHHYCLTTEQEFFDLTRPSFMSRPIVQYVEDPEERQNFYLTMVGASPALTQIRETGKSEFSVPFMLIKARRPH